MKCRTRLWLLICLLLMGIAALGAGPWQLAALAARGKNNASPIGSGPPANALAYPLHPASKQTLDISNLFWFILAESAVVFLFVMLALAYNFIKYSAKPGQREEPEQIYGNRRVEVAWTLIPALILAVAFGLTVFVMNQVNNPVHAAGKVINMDAIGHQWWWEFRFPGYHVVTANEFHIPVNTTVAVHITSADVIHSFWAPGLSRQIDATPNIGTILYINADKPGTYPGACYEFCGAGHAWMQFRVVVNTPAKFAAWVRHEASPPAQPTAGPALNGEQEFFSLSCGSCHTINGTTANGKAAPNLTHVASRWGIAGGVLPMSPQNLARWVNNPDSYKPGVNMPAFNIGKRNLDNLAAYLSALK
ncbi:MAG TPA: cytochrome c oxidase subunit II [Chloroflexota bacterium]|nr:cytochrome c oxidase subunit II [Chloroflexota bacterium]